MQRLLLLLTLLSCVLTGTAEGQRTEDEARDDLDYYNSRRGNDRGRNFERPLWFGTGAQLGFASNAFGSDFVIGLAPIVGYKLNNFLSIGPRGSFIYNALRRPTGGGGDVRINYFTYSIGAFTRAKVFRGFFAQVEYSLYNEADSFTIDNNGDAEVNRITRAIPFAGAGLSQGGGPGASGFEILILFRLTQTDRLNDQPYEFRTGINYNF